MFVLSVILYYYIIEIHEVESQEIGKMKETLHEVFEKVLYSVYYQSRDEKQNAPI